MFLPLIVVILSISPIIFEGANAQVKTIVNTTTGYVFGDNGGVKDDIPSKWYRFRGIPYAEPPIGNLRFEPPVPKQPWKGVFDSTQIRNSCVWDLNPVRGAEDCLFVKIYTPKVPKKTNKLPVMVWVYGGTYFMGSLDFEGGDPETLMVEDVMVVTFNYRTGIFGFLSTEDLLVPGNVGLKDQILALKWIKDNIENFGGDPERITLFGQSAGSASIAYLLQAPQTKGLFSGAIMLSGHSLNSWALTRKPLEYMRDVAEVLGIPTRSTKMMLEELRNFPAKEIQKATDPVFKTLLATDPSKGLPFGPVIEPEHSGAVITGKSYELLKNGRFNEVPILMGHTSMESQMDDALFVCLKAYLTTISVVPGNLVPVGMHITQFLEEDKVGREIKHHYLDGKAYIEGLRLLSDDHIVKGVYEAVQFYSKKVPVYYYDFAHEGALYGVTKRTLPGVGHSEDLGYLFDFNADGSADDYAVRDKFVKLVTNFAKYRNPTPTNDTDLNNLVWPANTGRDDIKMLNIMKEFEIITNPYNDHIVFWRKLFEKYGKPPFDTY